jgi:hypothetical protein
LIDFCGVTVASWIFDATNGRKINSLCGNILIKIIVFCFELISGRKIFAYYTARNCFASAGASAHKPCSHLQNDSFYPCDKSNYFFSLLLGIFPHPRKRTKNKFQNNHIDTAKRKHYSVVICNSFYPATWPRRRCRPDSGCISSVISGSDVAVDTRTTATPALTEQFIFTPPNNNLQRRTSGSSRVHIQVAHHGPPLYQRYEIRRRWYKKVDCWDQTENPISVRQSAVMGGIGRGYGGIEPQPAIDIDTGAISPSIPTAAN